MRKHRIEKAIVLGLILSTSIYGTSFAQEINETVVEQNQIQNNNGEAVTIAAGEESAIEPNEDISITTNSDNDITLNSDKYGIHIDDGHNVILNSDGNNIINIKSEANLNNENGQQDGIKIENGKTSIINFNAGEKNIIKATNNGIYVGSDNSSNVTFTANTNNEFITGNNGIDHRGAGTVNITSTNGANIIRAGIDQNTVLGSTDDAGYDINTIDKEQLINSKDGDGIRTQGNGTVNMTAGTYNDIVARDSGLFINSKSENSVINLTANGSNGTYGNIIYAQQSGVENDGNTNDNKINVTAVNSGNYIMAERKAERRGDGLFAAVYNKGAGDITIKAKKDNVLIAVVAKGVANKEDEINGVASDGTGKVEVISEEGNNIIFGTQNGILSNETGEINVTATQGNNIIGQYIDGNETVHTSENGINVSAGTVTVTAGNQNSIYGTKTGITATGKESKVILDGKINTITVNNNNTMNAGAEGITVNNNATVKINNNNKDNVHSEQMIIKTNTENGYSYGLHADENGNIIIETDKLQIDSSHNKKPNQSGMGEVSGILTGGKIADKEGKTTSLVDIDTVNDVDVNIVTKGVEAYGM